jgi:hypothetical protein
MLARSQWTWLYGIGEFNGDPAACARFVFHWKNRERREYQENMTRQDCKAGPNRNVVELFNEDLRTADMIGSRSLFFAILRVVCI